MKVVLTGATSFTGYWFARALAEQGAQVVAPIRGALEDYTGVRQTRAKALAAVAEIVPRIEFGSDDFFSVLDRAKCDALCHHAAHVADYRSLDFDIHGAVAANTREVRKLTERLAGSAGGFILTGSVFECREGAGQRPLRAFSPYGLSKALTSDIVEFWCDRVGLPFAKFVIANPFGPLEEPRFCSYLVKTWASGEVPEVRTPLYVRDNIHITLLAQAYGLFVKDVVHGKSSARYAPSFYVESQGAFAYRFSREMRQRLKLACDLKIGQQVDFSEPMVRINTDSIDLSRFNWREEQAWDDMALYYREQFSLPA